MNGNWITLIIVAGIVAGLVTLIFEIERRVNERTDKSNFNIQQKAQHDDDMLESKIMKTLGYEIEYILTTSGSGSAMIVVPKWTKWIKDDERIAK
jgi:hypothetical protein